MKKLLLILTLALLPTILSACNTVEGVGEDISSGARATGRAIGGN